MAAIGEKFEQLLLFSLDLCSPQEENTILKGEMRAAIVGTQEAPAD